MSDSATSLPQRLDNVRKTLQNNREDETIVGISQALRSQVDVVDI